jgi:hypothetical protein
VKGSDFSIGDKEETADFWVKMEQVFLLFEVLVFWKLLILEFYLKRALMKMVICFVYITILAEKSIYAVV